MIDYYRSCLNDPMRVHAYQKAIQTAIQPGDSVLDLGCGLGTYAMFAAQAGAKKVYAVDPNPIIYTAMELAKTNGLHKTIQFFKANSEDIQLPEPVDWIVTEFFGAGAIDLLLTPTLSDAVLRNLKPEGRVIPQTVRVYVAPFENHDRFQRDISSLRQRAYGLDFSPMADMMTNRALPTWLKTHRRLAKPTLLEEAQLRGAETRAFGSSLIFHCQKQGTIHGFGVWFDLDLVEGIQLSTAPNKQALAWGQYYLPLQRPIPVTPGQRVHLDLSVQRGTDGEVWWRWEGHRRHKTLNKGSFHFRQNSFRSNSLPPPGQHRLSSQASLTKSAIGQEVHFVLSQATGGRTVDALAKDLHTFSPKRYPTEDEARLRVIELSELLESGAEESRVNHFNGSCV